MKAWAILLLLIPPCGHADKRKPTAAECASIARYNDHVRAEVRGQKQAELEPECAPPKKAPAKRKPK